MLMTAGVLAWLSLAAVYAALGDAGVARHDALRGNVGLLAAMAFTLMVVAWVGWIERPSAWLVRLAAVLGNLSYGVYLFHNAAPWMLEPIRASLPGPWFALLCLAITAIAAQLMHWVFEAPCRRYGRRLAHVLDRRRPPLSPA